MSQENVDLVLNTIQPPPDVDFVPLFRDDETWEALSKSLEPLFHSDFTVMARGLPGGDQAYAGVDGLKQAWLDWLTPWASYHAEVEKAIDLGERVLLLYTTLGRLEGTSADVKAELASLWTFDGGKIARVDFFGTTHAEALEAVGLSE